MSDDIFPPITLESDDIIAWSEDIQISYLYEAYKKGIFPWPHSPNEIIPWFCPQKRAILHFDDLHVSKSLKKFLKKSTYEFCINTAFEDVINACAATPRKDERGTWIDQRIKDSFIEFHYLGYAYSFETWENDKLIGGLYGVFIDGHFSGESMFHRKDNASKFALINTIETLKEYGVSWIDIQQLTPLFEQFGAKEITRNEFLRLLKKENNTSK